MSEPPVTARVVDGSALAAFAHGDRFVAALVAIAAREDERFQLIVPCSALVEGIRSGLDTQLTELLVGAAGIVLVELDVEQAHAIAELERSLGPGSLELGVGDAAVAALATSVPVLTTDASRYRPMADRIALDVL